MNRYAALALVFGASVSAFAFVQQRFRYTDPSGNIVVLATDAGMDNVNGSTTKLDLSGKVDITSTSQGLHLTADRVTCIVAEAKTATAVKGKSKKELQSATAKGGLHVTKTVTNPQGKQTTDITGSEGQIDAKPTGNVVTIKGPVTLKNLDERKRSTMTGTGSSAVATLEPGDKSKLTNGLMGATLEGPVTMDLIETAAPGSPGGAHANGTADRMEISRSGTGSTVRLTGHVEIHGTAGSKIGNASGLSSATFELNAAGEVKSFKMKAGSGALLASIDAAEQQGVLELQSQPGVIRVTGYSTFSSDIETGETEVEGSGSGGLVTVEDTGKGMILTAPTMSCKILKDGKGVAAVTKANMSGGSNATFDSDISDRTAAEYAKSKGLPPPPPASKVKNVIKSQTIDYVREGLEATLSFANPFNWQSATSGVEPAPPTYKQDSLTEGDMGTIKFSWGASDLPVPQFSPESVHIAGNVHFHTEGLETPAAPAKAKLTKYDATGKTFDILFEQANLHGDCTITLTDDVKLSREIEGGTDTFTGAKVIITLRTKLGQLVPVRYQAFGNLAAAKIKTPAKKGGSK